VFGGSVACDFKGWDNLHLCPVPYDLLYSIVPTVGIDTNTPVIFLLSYDGQTKPNRRIDANKNTCANTKLGVYPTP